MARLVPPLLEAGSINSGSQPVLSAEGLQLRPWLRSDAAAVVLAYADPAVQRWHVTTMDTIEAEQWIEEQNHLWIEERGASWAVIESDEFMGRMALRTLSLATGDAEMAYWMLPGARGRGVAPRAAQAVAQWAFAAGLNRIELNHSVDNPQSCSVADKAGFQLEGTRRRAVKHLDGWHDMHMHARNCTDT